MGGAWTDKSPLFLISSYSFMNCKAPHWLANKLATAALCACVNGPIRPPTRLRSMEFRIGLASSNGGHSRDTWTRIWMGKGDVVALGFFEKAVGLIFCVAGVRASNIPNRRRSVTLNRKMDDPGTMQPAALFQEIDLLKV